MKETRCVLKRRKEILFDGQIKHVKEAFTCPHCKAKTLVSIKEGKLRCLQCGRVYPVEEAELNPEEKAKSLLYAAMDLMDQKDIKPDDFSQIESLLAQAKERFDELSVSNSIQREEICYWSGWICQMQARLSQKRNDLEKALFWMRKAVAKREEAKNLVKDEINLYLFSQSCKQAAWLAARLKKKGEKAWIDKGLQALLELEKQNPDYLEFILSQLADFYEMKMAYFERKGDEKARDKVFRDYLEWMRQMEKEYTQNASLFTLRFIGPLLTQAGRLQEKGFLNGSLYFYFKALDYQFHLFLSRPNYKSLKPLLKTYSDIANLLMVLDEPALAVRLLHTLMVLFQEEFRNLLARSRPKARVLELIEKSRHEWNRLLEQDEKELKKHFNQAKISIKAQKKRAGLLHLYNLAGLHLHLSFLETCRGDRLQRELLLSAARELMIELQVQEFNSWLNPFVLERRAKIEAELARAFALSRDYEEAARLYDQAATSYRELFELEPCWAYSKAQMQMLFYLADINQRSGNETEYRMKSQQALDLFDKYQQGLKQ